MPTQPNSTLQHDSPVRAFLGVGSSQQPFPVYAILLPGLRLNVSRSAAFYNHISLPSNGYTVTTFLFKGEHMLIPFPEILTPTATETIQLSSGQSIPVQKACPIFDLWTGTPLEDTYGKKTILNLDGEPVFAELAILRTLQRHGWNGVWVDTFTRAYRVAFRAQQEGVHLPTTQQGLLDQIYRHAGSTKGCWDVFCWRNEYTLFAESKRHKRDRLRDTQRRWLAAALACGLPLSAFLVVEWSVKASEPTAITPELTSQNPNGPPNKSATS